MPRSMLQWSINTRPHLLVVNKIIPAMVILRNVSSDTNPPDEAIVFIFGPSSS